MIETNIGILHRVVSFFHVEKKGHQRVEKIHRTIDYILDKVIERIPSKKIRSPI